MLFTRPPVVWALRGQMLAVTAITEWLRHRGKRFLTARRRRSESARTCGVYPDLFGGPGGHPDFF
eukprot:7222655-Prymnesium_polylepis.2